MAERRSPLAAYGPDGTTTLTPGMWQKNASLLSSCSSGALMPAP
jgi:hypothetical protein